MPKLILTRSQLQHKELLFAFLTQITPNKDALAFEDWRLVRINRTLPHNETLAPRAVQFMEDDITLAQKVEQPGSDMPQILTFSWRRGKCIYLAGTEPVEFLED